MTQIKGQAEHLLLENPNSEIWKHLHDDREAYALY